MGLIPWWVKALVAAGVALLAWAAWSAYTESLREDGRIEVRIQWSEAVALEQAAENARAAERRKKEQEAQREHDAALARARADADRAAAAAGQLRRQLDQWIAAARRDAGTGGAAAGQRPGEQGTDPLDLLAQLFTGADAAAGELAQHADDLRAAGLLCERRHQAVTDSKPSPPAAPALQAPARPD